MRDNRICSPDVIAGMIDHGLLLGLADNDHVQYVNAVSDTASIDLTLDNQSIRGDVIPGGISHNQLADYNAAEHVIGLTNTYIPYSNSGVLTDSPITYAGDIIVNNADLRIKNTGGDPTLIFDDGFGVVGSLYHTTTGFVFDDNLTVTDSIRTSSADGTIAIYDGPIIRTGISYNSTFSHSVIYSDGELLLDATLVDILGNGIQLDDGKYVSFGTSGEGVDASIRWDSSGYLDIRSADTRFSGDISATGHVGLGGATPTNETVLVVGDSAYPAFRINQGSDGGRFRIYGYDDKSTSYAEWGITSSGATSFTSTGTFIVSSSASVQLAPTDGRILIGGGVAGVNYYLRFDGENSDGYLYWMEDEDYFQFADKVLFNLEVEINGDLNHDGTNVGFYGTTPVAKAAALTTQLTTITIDGPSTPDYIYTGSVTNSSPYGLTTADEVETLLSVVRNLQVRVAELETGLASSSGVGLFT